MSLNSCHMVLLLIACIGAPGAHAQTTTPEPNTILSLGTGWGSDVFSIHVNRPIVNLANCPVADGYMSEAPHQEGHKTHHAAALMAFANGQQLHVTVSNSVCVHGQPAVIGLQVV